MDINVELKDSAGSKHSFVESISTLKFLKHASFAGMGPNFGWIPAIFSSIGLAFHFGSKFALRSDHIERTCPIYDPDDLRDMSRVTGRAIGDIFAKSHFNARYTLCYEHALAVTGTTSSGKSPDFYCIDHSGLKAFTVEAKGFSQRTIGSKQFIRHKSQSKSSQLPINYSVASVTHNIYNEIKARIEDPDYDSSPLDPSFSRALIDNYFTTINQRLSLFCEAREIHNIHGIPYRAYDATQYMVMPPRGGRLFEFLIPLEIPANTADSPELEDETTYFDRDGIGLRLSA